MKKGVFKPDDKFWDWFNQIKMNTIERVPVTISLLDESGSATMVWTLSNRGLPRSPGQTLSPTVIRWPSGPLKSLTKA